MDLRPFGAFASTHHGLLHRHAALALGASQSTWYRSIDRGLFARPEENPVDIILPRRSRRADLAGVVTHRPRDLKELRPVVRQGIPCVVPMRMLADLGAVVSDEEVVDALDELFTQRVVRRGTVIGALARHGRSGHHGIGALRRALEALSIGEDAGGGRPAHDPALEEVVDSKLEKKMDQLLRDFRLPPTAFHAEVSGFEVDFLVRGTRVVLECDGWEAHGLDREQFEFDQLRTATITGDGFVIVHFTWRQLTGGPEKVAQRIEHNLERWAPEVLAAHRRRHPKLWAR